MTTTRKTHIKRLFGFDPRTGETVKQVWVDVMRADVVTQEDRHGNITNIIQLNWDNEGNLEDLEGVGIDEAGRRYDIVYLTRNGVVTSRPDNEIFIKIPLINRFVLGERGGQTVKNRLRNRADDQGNEETGRSITRVRVRHSDTNVDEELDRGETVTGEQYRRDDEGSSEEDSGNYTDTEYLIKYPTNLGWDQQTVFKMSNKERFEQVNLALMETDGSNFGTPLRMDPLQDIVNVNFPVATYFPPGSSGLLPLDVESLIESGFTVLVVEYGSPSFSASMIMGSHQHVDGTTHYAAPGFGGIQSATIDVAENSGSINTSYSSSLSNLWGTIDEGGGQIFGCQTLLGGLAIPGFPCEIIKQGTIQLIPKPIPLENPVIGPPLSPLLACYSYTFWDGKPPLPTGYNPLNFPPEFGTDGGIIGYVGIQAGWVISGLPPFDPRPDAFYNNYTGTVVRNDGNWVQHVVFSYGAEVPPAPKINPRSWIVSGFSYKLSNPPRADGFLFDTKTMGKLEKPTPEQLEDGIADDGTEAIGDTSQFCDIDCTPAWVVPGSSSDDNPMHDCKYPDWEGEPDLNNVTRATIGNSVINASEEAILGIGDMTVAMIMVWGEYFDISEKVSDIYDRNEKGELVLKSGKDIVSVLGTPTLWYEGGPDEFYKNRAGGSNLEVSGPLETAFPYLSEINVPVDIKYGR